ncbi:TetR/AcrR family transcriptional regulator [Ferrimonas sp. YFM]|uniref:TetR/AcrR family transcriptional regulator n=1 Tax=Ferrimonas sp. YFM TaxID=3028878 RepID=UPI0025735420|nr:TetR/AcrR family transcriptional regulator [Ferrimonas sp. YFM]BDY06966.1 TetR family transcriptional regulator [Ferrimonas sp. YFM]
MHCPKTNLDIMRCNELLNVAESLVDENGVVSFRFAQMAKEASCSNHTLYKFFQSKEDVLVCLFLRNCTSNYMPLFLDQHPELTELERAAVPAVFSLISVSRSQTFNILRVVSINSMFWQMASDEKIALLKERCNLFWSRVHLHIEQAQQSGALQATEAQVMELTQAIYFFMAGSLSSYESQLMESKYLTDKNPTYYRHLAEMMNRYKWNEVATETKFENLANKIELFFDKHYKPNKNCERCLKFHGYNDVRQLPKL